MVAAKSAVYYLAKYFKKDSCTPKDLLILYHKAKILQERYPSTASDADTDGSRRRAKNFVQKLLNKTNGTTVEYTSTQVASCLIGADSQISSHAFWYIFVDACLDYQRRLHAATNDDGSADEFDHATPAVGEKHVAGEQKQKIRYGLIKFYSTRAQDANIVQGPTLYYSPSKRRSAVAYNPVDRPGWTYKKGECGIGYYRDAEASAATELSVEHIVDRQLEDCL
jgi:hypothetical protein